MRSKTAIGVACIAAAALSMTGCSGGSGSSDGLTWSMWIGSTEDQDAWQAVADAGTAASGQTVTLQGSPFADYWTKISTQLGTSSSPCIVSMQSLRLNQYTDALLPLDDLMAEDGFDSDAFDASALEAMQVDGTQYAIPYDNGPVILFYNRDAFAAAGVEEPQPGWTADQFTEAAEKLADNGQVALATSVEDISLEGTVFAYNGGRVVTENGELDLSDEAFADGVTWLSGLVTSGLATQANGPDSTADDNAFIAGNAAMLPGGAWLLLDLQTKAGFDIGVTTLPAGDGGGTTFSAGSGFGISKDCADPEAAFRAIQAMTSEDVLNSLAEQGRAFPSRTASQQVWYDSIDIDGLQEAMESALANSEPLPGSAQADELNQLLAQYGPQMVNGQESASGVLADIASQLGQ